MFTLRQDRDGTRINNPTSLCPFFSTTNTRHTRLPVRTQYASTSYTPAKQQLLTAFYCTPAPQYSDCDSR